MKTHICLRPDVHSLPECPYCGSREVTGTGYIIPKGLVVINCRNCQREFYKTRVEWLGLK